MEVKRYFAIGPDFGYDSADDARSINQRRLAHNRKTDTIIEIVFENGAATAAAIIDPGAPASP